MSGKYLAGKTGFSKSSSAIECTRVWQEKPQTPKGALKLNKMNLLKCLLQLKCATQQKDKRNSTAGKKYIFHQRKLCGIQILR